MAIQVADLVILAVLLFGAWRGFRNGLSGEIVRVAGLVVAFLVGARTHVPLGNWIEETTRLSAPAARALGFGAVFAGIWAVGHLARFILHKIMTITFVKPLEIAGGVAAGVIKTGAAISAVLIFINLAPRLTFVANAVNERSTICTFLSAHAPALYSSLRERYAVVAGAPGDQETGGGAPEGATIPEPDDTAAPRSEPEWEPLVFEPVDEVGERQRSPEGPEAPR